MHATVPDVSISLSRLDRLRAAAAAAGAGAVIVTPGSDLRYLIGVAGSSFERLTALVVPSDPGSAMAFVSPALEYAGLRHLPLAELGVEVRTWVDGEDPYALALEGIAVGGTVAVSDQTPVLHAFRLRDQGSRDHVLAGPILRELRMRKDPAELEELRLVGAAIDRVHAQVGEWLAPGRTESDRVIERGDLVVVDIGGPLPSGYNSDSTRTYAAGLAPIGAVADAYAALEQAQQAAVDAVRPGVTCESIDEAARSVLRDAGLGDYFIHRTGHGIGLDVHEEPYIVAGNDLLLEAGMTFSIEPGVYVPGTWGARIEDIVAVTADGVEPLNTRPHGLAVV